MKDLNKLIAQAKAARPSTADREAQRRSFAYGNTKIENERITRAIVDAAAKTIKDRNSSGHSK